MLYLIRHCSTQDNEDKLLCSSKDLPLSTKGLIQSEKISSWLSSIKTSCPAIISSPLLRAKQTAQAISSKINVPFQSSDLLAEREILAPYSDSTKEHLHKLRIEKNHVFQDVSQDWFDVVGVESDKDVHRRIKKLLDKEDFITNDVIFVTHAGSIKSFLHEEFNLAKTSFNHFKIRNGCIVKLSYSNSLNNVQLEGLIQLSDYEA